MAQKLLTVDSLRTGFPVIGLNSQAFSRADAVQQDSSGWLARAGTTTKILGWSADDRTMASDNQTVAKVTPLYVPAAGVLAQITADQAVTQTDIGAYADFGTVTSGAFAVNLLAGSTGQLLVHGSPDPTALSTDCIVEVAEPQNMAFTQD